MKKSIELFVANPAGNITLMVLTPIERDDYQTIANAILDMDFDGIKGEQVCFIKSEDTMEMCGLEFCGNASRAFAYYIVKEKGLSRGSVKINVSGTDKPLIAVANCDDRIARIQMPLPTDHRHFSPVDLEIEGKYPELEEGILFNIDGISHLIMEGAPASNELFAHLKHIIYDKFGYDLPAFGVMFVDKTTDKMTPVVYVRDVDTIYFEGSCASGTEAAAFSRALLDTGGVHTYKYIQPAGELHATVSKFDNKVTDIVLSGSVELHDPVTIEIDI